jgi:phenylpropionate dioxygenase-like ring-hydroxylating dioxygenase large terminal subunit
MQATLNERLTRIGPGMPCGALLRQCWQPVALVDEFDPALDPRMAERPLKAVRVLGEDFVLLHRPHAPAAQRWALLDRHCAHRQADLAFARIEPDGIRCPFHGWKFAPDGRCLETPAEPAGSRLCERVQQRSVPVQERAGVVWAWLGEAKDAAPRPGLPAIDAFRAPPSHSFAFKGLWHCNWLQAMEVGIDPAHPSFLHRYLEDDDLSATFGRQFRAASTGSVHGERWPMTRVMRERCNPEIQLDTATPGLLRLTALRRIDEALMHVRVTNALLPQAFVIPLSHDVTISQWHVPVDDTRTYWYTLFTSYAEPLDKTTMRNQRLAGVSLPDYLPRHGRHDDWGFDPAEQRSRTYLGMGEEDINRHDQWAVESPGPIADRTKEHLGQSDKAIVAYRRWLMQAIDAAEAGRVALSHGTDPTADLGAPDTVDCIVPADGWPQAWPRLAHERRASAPWASASAAAGS